MKRVEKIVGIVANLHYASGYSLVEVYRQIIEEYTSGIVGRCIVRDYSIDAVNIHVDLESIGVGDLILVAGKERGRPSGLYEYSIKPVEPSVGDIEDLRREVEASLTGSLDIDDVVRALKYFLKQEFSVVECDSGGRGVEYCVDRVREYISTICLDR